jgi:chorismate-pyruvate lyase
MPLSLVPVDSLDNDFRIDLIRADFPIGRIMKNHNIESRREIKSIFIEEQMKNLKKYSKPIPTS